MLISVLALAAVGVAITTTLLLLSIASSQTSLAQQESQQARAYASTCGELALQKLITTPAYLGILVVPLPQGSCTYSIAQKAAGANDKINAVGTINQTSRKVQIIVTTPNLSVVTWQEVGDFP